MRKQVYLVLCMFFSCLAANAAPGDTTWVQAHNTVQMPGYGAYDTTITFPNGSTTYRKIYMIFTLGKYQCPGNPQYCGDWDYTVQNYLMTPTGDTLELARLITPYANAGAPRTPWTWTQRYIYDVTDYYTVLKNSATMRIFYSGYSGGFTANIKFAFIEGTPERDIKGLVRLWNGSFGYGGAVPIDTNFQSRNETAPTGTQSADLKFTITGHGSDANQCCEFLSRFYEVTLNNNVTAHKDIWRSDCGSNELSPQSGTWLYERGNWCPGALVHPNYHNLPGVVAGNNFNVEINFQSYTGSGGSYTTEAQLFYHGAMNKTLDASVEDVIAPTNYEGYYRENPVCAVPTVKIRNTGATAITTVHFQYGVPPQPLNDYTWNGTLASLSDTTIMLPHVPYLDTLADTATHQFVVNIVDVNGSADADATNNSMSTSFKAAPQWPNKFIVSMVTNNEGTGGISETSWQLFDMSNNIVFQRVGANMSSSYNDTVILGAGCYKLVVTDGSCDGLHWWVWDQQGGVTAGSFRVRRITQIPSYLTLSGNVYGGTYHDDFGCGFTQYFTTLGFPAAVTNLSEIPLQIEAYPNPAQNTVNVSISGMPNVSGTLQLIDALGRVVLEKESNKANETLDIQQLSNGVYTVVFTEKNNASARLQTRLLIAK